MHPVPLACEAVTALEYRHLYRGDSVQKIAEERPRKGDTMKAQCRCVTDACFHASSLYGAAPLLILQFATMLDVSR